MNRFLIARFIQPICLGCLISYFAQSGSNDVTLADAYLYATGIVLTTAYICLTKHPYLIYVLKISCKIRAGCSGMIYRKTLRLLKSAMENGQNGQIINLLSSDLSEFEYALVFISEICKGPLQVLIVIVVAYNEIGVGGVVGVVTIVIFIPLQCKYRYIRYE